MLFKFIQFFWLLFVLTFTSLGERISPNLQDCSDFYGVGKEVNDLSLKMMQQDCEEQLMTMKPPHLVSRNFTQEEKRYINSLFRKLNAETSAVNGSRQKRHSYKYNTKRNKYYVRYRREVRTAPHLHWQRYASGVRRLKFDMVSVVDDLFVSDFVNLWGYFQ